MPWSQDVTGYRSGCHENPELDMDERNWINGPARQNYTQWAVGVKDLQAHAGRSMWPRSSHQSSRLSGIIEVVVHENRPNILEFVRAISV